LALPTILSLAFPETDRIFAWASCTGLRFANRCGAWNWRKSPKSRHRRSIPEDDEIVLCVWNGQETVPQRGVSWRDLRGSLVLHRDALQHFATKLQHFATEFNFFASRTEFPQLGSAGGEEDRAEQADPEMDADRNPPPAPYLAATRLNCPAVQPSPA
jgi:hypothetical protein